MTNNMRTVVAYVVLLTSTSGIEAQEPKPESKAEATPVATRSTIPLEALTARSPISAPILSPNGDRIAAVVMVGERRMVATMKLFEKDDGVKSGLRPILVLKDSAVAFKWLDNDSLLVQSLGLSANLFGSQLLVHDVVTEKQRPLKLEKMYIQTIVHIDPAGRFLLVSARKRGSRIHPGIYRIDIASGAATLVLEPVSPVTNWYADTSGVIRLGSGRSGRTVKYLYRDSENEEFTVIAKRRWADVDADVETVRFRGGRADRGFIVSNVQTGRFGVYEFDWKEFEIGAAIFEHPQVDVDNVWFNAQGELAAVLYTDDKPRIEWLDPELKKVQAEIDAALGGRNNRVVSMDESQTRFMVLTSTPDDPGHYYYFNRPAGLMKRIASVLEIMKGRSLSPMKPVTYASRDGMSIPAYLTTPVGVDPKKLPLIVMPHGGPHARDTWQYDPYVQFLAGLGYAVLQPNFRGSSGFGVEYLKLGYGQWGGAMQDDVTDGVQWLVKEGIADAQRVCIMGSSYGGYAALMGAIKTPQLYRCAISFAGVTSVDKLLTQDPYWSVPSRYGRLKEKLEGELDINLKSVSPARLADQVGVPVLLAHGRLDPRVRFSQAEDMRNALKRAGKEFEFVEFKEAGHGFHKPADQLRYLQAVEAFLTKHNPSDRMIRNAAP